MAWHIGIDEAGYGPNLGPFVMTLAACRVPEEHADADLWRIFRGAVRRPGQRDDGRLLIGDSKEVYSPSKGLADLETSVLASLRGNVPSLRHLIEQLCPHHLRELEDEIWFVGATPLPIAAPAPSFQRIRRRWDARCGRLQCEVSLIRSLVVCPPRFNALIDRWDSKASVLGLAFAELIGALLTRAPAEALSIVVDKHGGRNCYADILQNAFPDGLALGREESMARSVYDVLGMAQPIRVTFMPRADDANLCVALASMVSKYLRELLMAEFNSYWRRKVDGLKPTAGYPGDAARFFDAIEPHLAQLGIAKEKMWRKR